MPGGGAGRGHDGVEGASALEPVTSLRGKLDNAAGKGGDVTTAEAAAEMNSGHNSSVKF